MPTKRFLAFSCTHFPKHDPESCDWIIEQVRKYRPDIVVHQGDLLEAAGASRWENEEDFDLEDEFSAADKFLRIVRRASKKGARFVLLPGNHDDNIIAPNRIHKALRRSCDYRERITEIKSGAWQLKSYRHRPDCCVHRLGQVTFIHGFYCNQTAERDHAVQLGTPNGLLVMGHTHRPRPVTQARLKPTIPLPYWYANTGTHIDFDKANYVYRKNTQEWGQAVCVGEAADLKSPRAGRHWDAEVVVRRMAWDEGGSNYTTWRSEL